MKHNGAKTDKNSFNGSLQTKGAFFRKSGYELVQNQISDSAKRYLDPKTGEIDAVKTTERNCLVCGSVERRLLFKKNQFPHVKCLECDFIYVNPILREDVLIDYYSGIKDSWAEMTEKDDYNEFQKKYYHFQVDNIQAQVTTSNHSILDIGCNNGEFLMVARERGWTPVGHEINRYAVDLARKKGIEVFDEKFSAEIFHGRKFGAITLFGVLEHLPYPGQFLEIVHSILEPGGVLTTHVPNADSLVARVLQEKCITFDGIEHVNFWNRDTFGRFLNEHGFELAHAETAISEIYTLNNHLHFEYPYACPDEYSLLLDVITPEYLHERFLGHLLCCTARPV